MKATSASTTGTFRISKPVERAETSANSWAESEAAWVMIGLGFVLYGAVGAMIGALLVLLILTVGWSGPFVLISLLVLIPATLMITSIGMMAAGGYLAKGYVGAIKWCREMGGLALWMGTILLVFGNGIMLTMIFVSSEGDLGLLFSGLFTSVLSFVVGGLIAVPLIALLYCLKRLES